MAFGGNVTMHARVVTRRRDRRINGALGKSFNLCGAAPTDRDLEPKDFKKACSDPSKWFPCPACRAKLDVQGSAS